MDEYNSNKTIERLHKIKLGHEQLRTAQINKRSSFFDSKQLHTSRFARSRETTTPLEQQTTPQLAGCGESTNQNQESNPGVQNIVTNINIRDANDEDQQVMEGSVYPEQQ